MTLGQETRCSYSTAPRKAEVGTPTLWRRTDLLYTGSEVRSEGEVIPFMVRGLDPIQLSPRDETKNRWKNNATLSSIVISDTESCSWATPVHSRAAELNARINVTSVHAVQATAAMLHKLRTDCVN